MRYYSYFWNDYIAVDTDNKKNYDYADSINDAKDSNENNNAKFTTFVILPQLLFMVIITMLMKFL